MPLHLASEFDAHEKIIDMLIDADPQTLYVTDNHGITPLDYLKTRQGFDIKSVASYSLPACSTSQSEAIEVERK